MNKPENTQKMKSKTLHMLLWHLRQMCLALMLLLGCQHLHADDYKLGPGDLLRITVFDHQELAQEAQVSQSGNISFPLVGVVAVQGLSTRDVEVLLAKKLVQGAYIRNPQVSVIIGEYQSQKMVVIGQVNKPGQYPLTEARRVLDVLSQAGGLLPDASADTAALVHSDGSVQTVDLVKLLNGDMSTNFDVRNGDTLSVPPATKFYIYGQVQRPGVYKLTRSLTVSQAISVGGGLTKHGTERRAIVKRRDADGKENTYSAKPSDVLQADDVLMIKESWF